MTETNIHKIVMRRVRTVHTLRTLFSPTVLSLAVVLAALWGIGRQVWVARVFENMPSLADLGATSRFLVSAFLHTEFIVQALSVAVLLAAFWFVRDAVRILAPMRTV